MSNKPFKVVKFATDITEKVTQAAAYSQEVTRLFQAIQEGRLSERAKTAGFTEEYQGMLGFINQIIDAIVDPLQVAAQYMDRVGKGDIPEPITQEYRGDFNNIKNSINDCITALRSLIEEDGGVALQGAAARDLTRRVEREYQGAYAQMKDNINSVLENLDQALQQVSETTEQVSAAAGELSSGSQTLAQGASEQASSLEQIASSLEELTSMSKQNAANAQEARGLAESAGASTKRGVESMNRFSLAIEKIKTSSDETAKIIKTIDEIAFQTNLLALNAAVEAARAGEAGKGFAVVAEEVRNLAMRSAEAAKNTANLIEGSVKNAEQGVVLNQEVLKNFGEINEQIGKVSAVIAEISTGSEQQSEGIVQINAGVDQLNQVTQQNAANAEESASAAEELSSQSEEMRRLVADFELSNSSPAEPEPAPLRGRPAARQPVKAAPQAQAPRFGVRVGGNGSEKSIKRTAQTLIPLDDEDAQTLRKF